MSKIKAQILIPNRTKCSNAVCNKTVNNLMTTIFIVRLSGTLAFCCPDCYNKATKHYLDQVRASEALRGKSDKELLKSLGYKPGESCLEE